MAAVTPHHTHLVKHPVSKLQELPEEVQPAVQEGEEAQQQEHDTWGRREGCVRDASVSGRRSRISRREEERLRNFCTFTPALKAIHLKGVIKLLDQI